MEEIPPPPVHAPVEAAAVAKKEFGINVGGYIPGIDRCLYNQEPEKGQAPP